MNLKTLCTKCGEHSSPLSLFFGKFDFCDTVCIIFVLLDYRKSMEELRFSKKQQRTAMHSRLCVVSLCSSLSYIFQSESDKYIQGIPIFLATNEVDYKLLTSPPSSRDYI